MIEYESLFSEKNPKGDGLIMKLNNMSDSGWYFPPLGKIDHLHC